MKDCFDCWIFALFQSERVLQVHLHFTKYKNLTDALICPVFPRAASACHLL